MADRTREQIRDQAAGEYRAAVPAGAPGLQHPRYRQAARTRTRRPQRWNVTTLLAHIDIDGTNITTLAARSVGSKNRLSTGPMLTYTRDAEKRRRKKRAYRRCDGVCGAACSMGRRSPGPSWQRWPRRGRICCSGWKCCC